MGTAYEVTYRNMWPSDALNARIRDNFGALRENCREAVECNAWFERAANDNRLSMRIEVIAGGTLLDASRTLGSRKDHRDVCAEIDSVFQELRKHLSRAA